MSHWGYVVEALTHEDDADRAMRVQRQHRLKNARGQGSRLRRLWRTAAGSTPVAGLAHSWGRPSGPPVSVRDESLPSWRTERRDNGPGARSGVPLQMG